jgi:hypothetical protein
VVIFLYSKIGRSYSLSSEIVGWRHVHCHAQSGHKTIGVLIFNARNSRRAGVEFGTHPSMPIVTPVGALQTDEIAMPWNALELQEAKQLQNTALIASYPLSRPDIVTGASSGENCLLIPLVTRSSNGSPRTCGYCITNNSMSRCSL